MSTNSRIRITQRQPLACLECTRRKVKCDKQIPCSRCRRTRSSCSREKVLVSNVVTRHGEELTFLKSLEEKLLSPNLTVNDLANEISKRISTLESGSVDPKQTASENQRQYELNSDKALPVEPSWSEALATSTSPLNQAPEYAATIVLESLAWGRHYGGCYPHRRCNCYRHRSFSEVISIRSDSTASIPSLVRSTSRVVALIDEIGLSLSQSDSRKLVKFHMSHLAWHHGVLHTPTFLEQCEIFWSTGQYRHPLWMALYFSVLSSTTWSIQNSTRLQEALNISVAENLPQQLFKAMIETLYAEKFLEAISMYSVQAIVISTEAAHNLDYSDVNANLMAAAIRISQCMGLHKITDPSPSDIQESEQWHEAIEREIGKRIWCQIVIQDHFGLCFTDSYNINPKHCLTQLPKNCDDHDLEEHDNEIPTISSYIRTLAQIAQLVPRLFEELGPRWNRKPIREKYRDVIQGDRDIRHLVGDIPAFLLRGEPNERMIDKPWLNVSRRSLAIITAEKIILIHRPFLFPSFRTSHYPHTRSTCVRAATTILREWSNILVADDVSFCEYSTCSVTASIILCLQLLYPENDLSDRDETNETRRLTAHMCYDLVNFARERLAIRRGDFIAKRGVLLIDALLSAGGLSHQNQFSTFVPPSRDIGQELTADVHVILQKVMAQFSTGDEELMGVSNEALEWTSNQASPLDMDFSDVDFDTWFDGVFGAQNNC